MLNLAGTLSIAEKLIVYYILSDHVCHPVAGVATRSSDHFIINL